MIVLFVGPFVLDTVLMRKAKEWQALLQETYDIDVEMQIAEPPFQAEDDIECRGYWLKPDAKTYESRVKLSLIHI